MEEPSVLDYLKARLSFWRGPAPAIPALPEGQMESQPKPARSEPVEQTAVDANHEALITRFPWRASLAFGLFIFAQRLWIPPQGYLLKGFPLAVAALVLTFWAAREGEWRLPKLTEGKREVGMLTVQRWPLVVSLLCFAFAFFTSHSNLFTWLNVSLWVAAVAFALIAFWQQREGGRSLRQDFANFLRRGDWTFTLSNESLLFLATFSLIAFFRLYQLAGVPSEMLSDHAEKLLDILDVLNGQTSIFFVRNTGREPLQFYLTAGIARLFGTGLTFISLKIGTAMLGLFSLIYVYLLGKEVGGRWVGLLAMLLTGVAYWPNVLARTGLRFILYPAFVAPTLFHLLRGLRRRSLNDFLLSGLFLGLGLHGYTAFRVVPLVVLVAVGIFLLHVKQTEDRRRVAISLVVLILLSLIVLTPLLRYALEEGSTFSYRMLTRMSSLESPLPGSGWLIFLRNLWNALLMPVYSAGSIWLVGLVNRPALDLVTGALFMLGVPLVFLRYLRQRNWQDLFLLVSIPILMLPSIMALAFPQENPALNRASGASLPIFLVAAIALDSFLHGIRDRLSARYGLKVAWASGALLLLFITTLNYDLVFRQYAQSYAQSSWNSSEMGEVIREFEGSVGIADHAWVVAYPHWVDTRLVAFNARYPGRDLGIWPEQLESTQDTLPPKLFLLNLQDVEGLNKLQALYPFGTSSLYTSAVPTKDFVVFFVPLTN